MSVEMLNIWKVKCDRCGRSTVLPSEYTPGNKILRKFGYHTIFDHPDLSLHLCCKCFEEDEEDYA